MQIFLFVSLAISLLALVFALQNNVPVTAVFFSWTIQGSLALLLFLSLIAGVLISFLASLPTLIKGRMAASQQRKQLAALETSLAESRRRISELEARLAATTTPVVSTDVTTTPPL